MEIQYVNTIILISALFGSLVTLGGIIAYVVARLTKFEVKIDALSDNHRDIKNELKTIHDRVSYLDREAAVSAERRRQEDHEVTTKDH